MNQGRFRQPPNDTSLDSSGAPLAPRTSQSAWSLTTCASRSATNGASQMAGSKPASRMAWQRVSMPRGKRAPSGAGGAQECLAPPRSAGGGGDPLGVEHPPEPAGPDPKGPAEPPA